MFDPTDATPAKKAHRCLLARCTRLLLSVGVAVALFGGAGCSVFTGQVEVRGTDQRLIVGHNVWPFKQIWVLENGKIHPVTVRFR